MKLSHVFWNLFGLGSPIIFAIFSIPLLMNNIGSERFGLIALSWGLMSYAGILDLGIGRSLTQLISSYRGKNELSAIYPAYFTAVRITLSMGILGGFLIILLSIIFGIEWLNFTEIDGKEVFYSVILLAVALPAQAMSATYRGVNDAFLNFKGTNIIRSLLGIINFFAPAILSLFTKNLIILIGCLVISRLLALYVFRLLAINCLKRDNLIAERVDFSREKAKVLLNMGGWLTLSNIASPIMVQMPRFFIAAMISSSAVTLFVVPYEMISQMLILVGAISSVFFPTLTKMISEKNTGWISYLHKWIAIIFLLMFSACYLAYLLLPYIFPLWLQESFSEQMLNVGTIILLGVFFNAIASMYYAALQALGKMSITAKIHLVELPLFLCLLYCCVAIYGIEGAALAWAIRMFVDLILLMFNFYKRKEYVTC